MIDDLTRAAPPRSARGSARRRAMLLALLARPLAGLAPVFAVWLRGWTSVIRGGWVLSKDD